MNILSIYTRGILLRSAATVIAIASFVTHAISDDMSDAKQFVNATTIGIIKIDSKKLGLPESLTKKLTGEESNALQREAKPIVETVLECVKALNGESVFIAVDVPFSKSQSPVRLLVKNTPALNLPKLLSQLERFQFSRPVLQGDYFCFSAIHSTESSSKIAIAESVMPSVRPDLERAMQEVRDLPIQVLVLPPDYLWATFRDLLPTLPAKFGGGPSSLLTDGVRWIAIGIDPSKLSIQAVAQSRSAESADALAAHIPKLMQALASQFRLPAAKSGIEQMSAIVKPIVQGDQVTFSTTRLSVLDANLVALTGVIQEIVGPLTNQIKMDRFKQIGLALHNFESANRVLPPAKDSRAADGKCILSWRVHILPYIGQINLYNQFRLKEPWNSEHNLKLLDQMPDIYKGTATGIVGENGPKPGYTTFLAPVGDDTIFGGVKPVKFGDVKDGLSNTIWLVEVKPELAKPWTAPEDFAFDPANPAMGLAEITGDKPSFLAALGDGSVKKIPLSLPAKTILHLFQKSDANVIEF